MSDTLFKEVKYTLGSLMEFIGFGEIGLPDIQRLSWIRIAPGKVIEGRLS